MLFVKAILHMEYEFSICNRKLIPRKARLFYLVFCKAKTYPNASNWRSQYELNEERRGGIPAPNNHRKERSSDDRRGSRPKLRREAHLAPAFWGRQPPLLASRLQPCGGVGGEFRKAQSTPGGASPQVSGGAARTRAACPSGGIGGSFRGSENRLLGAAAPSVAVQTASLLDGAAVVFIFLGVAGVLAVGVDMVFLGVDVVEVLRRHAENLRK